MICQVIMSKLKQDFLKQRTTLQQKTVTFNSHLVDTLIIRTLAKSQAQINCWHLTEINSCYYGLLLMRTLTHVPTVREIANYMQLWISLYSAYLILDDNMIFDSQIKHLLVPFHKAFVFRNFLLNRMAMKNVVISFTRWTSPYVSHLISVTR